MIGLNVFATNWKIITTTCLIIFNQLNQTDKKTGGPKVWVYKDKHTSQPKGEATVTYDDPETAKAAIEWFNGVYTKLVEFVFKTCNFVLFKPFT